MAKASSKTGPFTLFIIFIVFGLLVNMRLPRVEAQLRCKTVADCKPVVCIQQPVQCVNGFCECIGVSAVDKFSTSAHCKTTADCKKD
ncbi:putative defensin-like protein 298 [Mangifera indica]|uniref:putative defensin-like protein 298 n=1 Tax=Mangifera indica TaxID=29780 RepID=UPI001CF9D0BF|nr:putative defensin-like protein 298 [Mangifera indica]